MHIVEHLFCFGQRALVHIFPDFIVAGMAKEPDADHDISLQGQPLLRFKKFVLETGAAAKGDDFVFSFHVSITLLLPLYMFYASCTKD